MKDEILNLDVLNYLVNNGKNIKIYRGLDGNTYSELSELDEQTNSFQLMGYSYGENFLESIKILNNMYKGEQQFSEFPYLTVDEFLDKDGEIIIYNPNNENILFLLFNRRNNEIIKIVDTNFISGINSLELTLNKRNEIKTKKKLKERKVIK